MNSKLFICKGRVQGVSLRYMVQKKATELNLKGYVRNLPDNSVEILVQGNKIDELRRFIGASPGLSSIQEITAKEVEEKEYDSFRIRY